MSIFTAHRNSSMTTCIAMTITRAPGRKCLPENMPAHVPAQGRPDRPNNWEVGLSEAALITGLERNADVVVMASYAPAARARRRLAMVAQPNLV